MSQVLTGSLAREGERFALRRESDSTLAVFRLADETRVGEVRLSGDSGILTIDALCIETPHRSYGAGSEAAWLLISAAKDGGVKRLRAWAHPQLGLSVYFWTRMGLSPQHGNGPEGGIWFERGL